VTDRFWRVVWIVVAATVVLSAFFYLLENV
jgi:hypothetical protein